MLNKRQTRSFTLTKTTDVIWWFYFFWGAKFLADEISILERFLSYVLIKKGWTINKVRKITLLICTLIILPVTIVEMIDNK